jgi:predicted enzyme related to lactoylglutathione lyase
VPALGAPVDSFVITIDVADLDATIATITGAGGTVVRSRQPVPGVGWQAYFRDPDGNLFGVLQPDASAK